MDLAIERGLSTEQIYRINKLHARRSLIFEEMRKIDDAKSLRLYDNELNILENNLQILWGFLPNQNFIRFWERPKCRCPKIDNEDNYGVGYFTIAGDCPLHSK